MLHQLINRLHKSKFVGFFFHTLDYCLKQELSDCSSVLDLGCGPSSPLKSCNNIKYSVGVEAFKPYLLKSKNANIHSKYICKKIEDLNFDRNSFDAVIMIEVLEHLPEKEGHKILRRAEQWAKKKVIISSPNGYIHQKELDNNILQKHLSGWDYAKMSKLGFSCHGLAGFKIFRTENEDHTMGDDLMATIKYRPKPLWFAIASVSQMISYYLPKFAFEIFSVKKIS